jgi:hypothetical protein
MAISHSGGMCAVQRTGAVWCPGGSEILGYTVDRNEEWLPHPVHGIAGAVEVDTSSFMGACVRIGGRISCWGGERADPVHVLPGVTNAVQIALADDHACARLGDATIACWGSNRSGELGVPKQEQNGVAESSAPIVVPGVRGAVDVAVGGGERNEPARGVSTGDHGSSCALTDDGDVLCWGGGSSTPTREDVTVRE